MTPTHIILAYMQQATCRELTEWYSPRKEGNSDPKFNLERTPHLQIPAPNINILEYFYYGQPLSIYMICSDCYFCLFWTQLKIDIVIFMWMFI